MTQPKVCRRCGNMRQLRGSALDQAVPGAGYTKENTRLVLFAYNAMKSTASAEEAHGLLMEMAEALK